MDHGNRLKIIDGKTISRSSIVELDVWPNFEKLYWSRSRKLHSFFRLIVQVRSVVDGADLTMSIWCTILARRELCSKNVLESMNSFCFLSHTMFITMTMTNAHQSTYSGQKIYRIRFRFSYGERDTLSPKIKKKKITKRNENRIEQERGRAKNHRRTNDVQNHRWKNKMEDESSRVLHSILFVGCYHCGCGASFIYFWFYWMRFCDFPSSLISV